MRAYKNKPLNELTAKEASKVILGIAIKFYSLRTIWSVIDRKVAISFGPQVEELTEKVSEWGKRRERARNN